MRAVAKSVGPSLQRTYSEGQVSNSVIMTRVGTELSLNFLAFGFRDHEIKRFCHNIVNKCCVLSRKYEKEHFRLTSVSNTKSSIFLAEYLPAGLCNLFAH